jgi:predicted nucleic acid-binding protein
VEVSRIFWDTNLFIYLIEDQGERGERTVRLAERMIERGDELCTSTLTLGEILVKPLERNELALRERYEEILNARALLIPFDRDAARVYSEIRRDRTIRPPDAIQLSCAAVARVDLFITNDDRLSRKAIPGVQFVSSLERAFI